MFLIKIVHCFLHKLFLTFCIKLFSVQYYLKNCSLSFLHKLFFVHCLKNCSLFSHKTPSEIVFSKFKSQIWMFFHVWISQWLNLFFCIDKICFYINKICSLHIMFIVYSNLFTAFIKSFFALIKTGHYFLIKIVHCFLHKLFLALARLLHLNGFCVFFLICNHMNNGQTPWKKNEWFV